MSKKETKTDLYIFFSEFSNLVPILGEAEGIDGVPWLDSRGFCAVHCPVYLAEGKAEQSATADAAGNHGVSLQVGCLPPVKSCNIKVLHIRPAAFSPPVMDIALRNLHKGVKAELGFRAAGLVRG